MMKRFLSLFLALCLTLAMLPGVLPQAEAATVSFSQANSAARAALPFTAEEFEVIRLTNKERMAEGLHPVTTFVELQNACDIRAKELVDLFSHTRPDGSSCWTAMAEAGVKYYGAAENIAAGHASPREVVIAWMNSEGHRANILNGNLDHMGVGYYYQYGSYYGRHWVQMFARYYGEEYTGATVYVPEGEAVGTGIDDMYMYAVLYSNVYGNCYLPISSEFVSNYDPNSGETQTITLKFLGFSGTVTITLGGESSDPVTPEPPEAPVVKISANTDTGKPKLTWEAVEGADLYRIYRTTSKSGKYSYYKSTRSTGFTDAAAEAGTNYYYKVRAMDEEYDLLSGYSNAVNRVCDLAKPVVSITGDTASGKPKVQWETVEGAAKYQIYRATSKSGEYELVKTAITARSFIDTTAEVGTNYYYKVKAVHTNSSADSAYSAVVNRVCDLAKPVVKIKLTDGGDPKLTWEKDENAAKYYVYRSTSKDSGYTHVKTTVSARSYTDTTAEAGTRYYYKVKAIHAKESANSAYSSVKYITAQ